MTPLLEPPLEVVWTEQAGPMPWREDPTWEPSPVEEPDDEVAHRLAELEAAYAFPAVFWAVPGVTGGDAERLPPSPEVAHFAAAVHRLEASDPSGLSPEQALVDLGELMRVGERLRIAQLTRMTDAHVRRLSQLDNQPSLASWVRRRWDDVPRADIALSDKLRPYVLLRRLVQGRELGIEAAALVGRALDKLKHHVDRDNGLIDGQPGDEVVEAVVGNIVPLVSAARMGLEDEDPLLLDLLRRVEEIVNSADSQLGKLELAFSLMGRHIPLNLLKNALAQQVDALLPLQLDERGDKAVLSRNLRLDKNRAYGGGRITIEADDELYELAETVLGAAVRRDPQNPADTEASGRLRNSTIHGDHLEDDDVEADGDVRLPRTRGQRLHDGLKLVLQQHLAAGLAGSADKMPVRLTVTVSRENVEGRPGALPAVGSSGRSLPRSLVQRWWCNASVTALVLSRGLIPLGITHETRTLTAVERRASRVQHGQVCSGLRCCTPNDPLAVLVPHHVRSFAKFGKTSIGETIWACDRLHDAIHRGKTVPLRNGKWLNADGYVDAPLIPTTDDQR